jgi:hypothetical protein
MSVAYLPIRAADNPEYRKHIETTNALIAGKADVTGTVTLTPNSATTVVTDNRFESGMVPYFTATTANAAAAVGGMYVSARGNKTFTLTHANNAQADKTFIYGRLG